MAWTVKAYSVPLILFALSILCQLVFIPKSFPPSHYDVLGIRRYSTIEEVKDAYEKLSTKWNSGVEVPSAVDFIKIRYAYELLTNPVWKRDYDIFGIDDQLLVIEELKQQYDGENFSRVDLPVLNTAASDLGDHAFNDITSKDFQSMFRNSKPWLIQVYSFGSNRCVQFANAWKRIATLLDGVANTGMVELGEVKLATYLAERRPTGQPFFRNGIPSLVAFPPGCQSSDCHLRFEGEISVDAVTDWFATTVLSLPRLFYHSKESLAQDFMAKSSPHKVKVIFFSNSGERAAPFIRQAAKDYWAYASFAIVLWREEDASFWWKAFEVESAPAIVFLKEQGVKPVVYHGSVNNSWFSKIMEQNKQQELPQLRSATSMELGCDARGYSRAGNDTMTWYCVILAGRQSLELHKMRETMRRVQQILSDDSKLNAADKDQSASSSIAAIALKNKRLTFAWLDGEAQQKYCFFCIQSETSYETCGPRRDITDVPRIFIVRYKRNATEDSMKVESKPKTIWDALLHEEVDPASQLVATYNGLSEIPEIVQWMAKIIEDGDSKDLPFYRVKTPELVPEKDAESVWSRSAKRVLSKSMGMKQRIHGIISSAYDLLGDPRIGPALLLGALISFGTIWLQRSQLTHRSQSNQASEPSTEENEPEKRDRPRNVSSKDRIRPRNVSSKDRIPSITDVEPKDAYQMPLPDSDSE